MLGSFYRTIIRNAFVLSWRNRYIWIFGLFAAVLGNGGEYEIFFRAIGKSSQGTVFPILSALYANNVFSFLALKNFFSKLFTHPFSFFFAISIIALFLLVFAFLVWLSSVSQAALVYSADRLQRSKKTDFGVAYSEGRKYFLQVFGLNIIYYIVITIVLSIVGLPIYLVFFSVQNTEVVWFYLLNFLIFLPLAIIISFVIKYALAYVVLEGKSFLDAIFYGWKLFIKNWLVSIEMVIILMVIDFIFGFGTLFLMVLSALPLMIFGLLMSYYGATVAMVIMYVLALMVAFVILVAVGMFVMSFQYSAWTLLFKRLTKQGGISKLVRLFSG